MWLPGSRRQLRPGSGGASRGRQRGAPAGLPWCHTTAVANRLLPSSQRQKLTFPEALPGGVRPPLSPPPRDSPTLPPPVPRGENSKAVAKNNDAATVSTRTPIFPKTFLQQQATGGGKTNAQDGSPPTPPPPLSTNTHTHTLRSTLWCQVTGYLSHLHAKQAATPPQQPHPAIGTEQWAGKIGAFFQWPLVVLQQKKIPWAQKQLAGHLIYGS